MRWNSMICGVIFAVSGVVARPALADVAPPGLCTGQAAGDECDEAVDEQGQVVGAGVCVAETCHRATPDGSMAYDCLMCRPKGDPSVGGGGGEAGAPDVSGGMAGASPQGGTAASAGSPSNGGTASSAGSPSNGGTASNGGKAGQGGAAHAGSATSTKSDKADSGCSVGSGARDTSVAVAISLLGLGAVLRRKRSARSR